MNVSGIRIPGTQYSVNAVGGIFSKPTLGWFGEDGPEAIIPLSQRYRSDALSILPKVLDAVGGGGGGGGTVVNLNTNVVQHISRDVDITTAAKEITFQQTVALRAAGVIA